MSQILADREKIKDGHYFDAQKKIENEKKDEGFGYIADMLDGLVELITGNTQKVRVLNLPAKQKVEGYVSLTDKDELLASFDDLEKSLCDEICEMKEEMVSAINSDKEVTVKNQPEPIEIEIPEKVTAIIETMPAYVEDLLIKVHKAVKELKLSVKVEPTKVVVPPNDFTALETRFKALETLLQSLLDKELPEIEQADFSPLETALSGIGKTLVEVKKNTGVQTSQTFKASWDKSFDMKSKDMATVFHYITHSPSSKKVVNYIEVTDTEGSTFRRTFSFDTDGDVISATSWTKQ